MDKQTLRQHFKRLRADLDPTERARIDGLIAQQVLAIPEYERCQLLLPYLSFGAEIDTRAIIEAAWAAGKTVALPRCIPGTREMAWYAVDSFAGLIESSFGVEEPAEDSSAQVDVDAAESALVLVPGLTFDVRGYRMGYGGGFYDVFLARSTAVSVGLCRECQMSEAVEALDEHDLPVGIVVTEKRVVRVGDIA